MKIVFLGGVYYDVRKQRGRGERRFLRKFAKLQLSNEQQQRKVTRKLWKIFEGGQKRAKKGAIL